MLINLKACKPNTFTVMFLTTIIFIAFSRLADLNIFDQLLYYLTKWQSEFNKDAALKIKLLRNNYSTELFQALLTTSFLYGMLHAIGPGHGKSIILGWILTQQRRLKDIVIVTTGATFLHAFSAVAIVASIFYLVGKYLPGTMGTMYLWLNVVSGLILVITGFQLFYENYQQNSKQTYKKNSVSSNLQSIHPAWIALSIGIVPCPLAAVMFIACLTSDMVASGLLLVAAFALGMGVTLFLVATTVWSIKNKTTRADSFGAPRHFFKLVNVVSALFFIVLGILIILPNIQKAL
jgi:ABC-type nickel/cobalt efflux system permease component RcnA